MKIVVNPVSMLAFILVLAFPVFHFFTDYSSFIKPVFIIGVAIAFCSTIFEYRLPLHKSELIFLTLICVIFLQSFLYKQDDYLPILFLLSVYLLYRFFYSFIQHNTIFRQRYFINIYSVLILSEIILFFFHPESSVIFFSPNSSIFSILLASQLAFIIPFFLLLRNKAGIYKIALGILLLLGIITLIKANGRAGWIGLSAALLFLYIFSHKINRRNLLLFISVFIVFASFLFIYKSGSSSGRLLIYKVIVSEISPKELLSGIGYGQFKIKYNLLQSGYFSRHSINTKESQLADHTYFAFNDPFQFIIETGLPGLVLLVLIVYLILRSIITKKNIIQANTILMAAYCSLICISTAALFSYPLQIPAILIQFILCIAIISYYGFAGNGIHGKGSTMLYKAISIGAALLTFAFGIEYFKYSLDSKEAFRLSRSGFRSMSIEKYEKHSRSLIKDGNVLFRYASELSKSKDLKRSNEVLAQAKKYYSNIELYSLMAENDYELKNMREAEKNYKLAVNMIPNRMMSRSQLLNYYINVKDTSQAITWAKSILNMPVKVPSQITLRIQEQAKKSLIRLYKN